MIQDYHKIAILAGERNISYAEMLQKIAFYAQQTAATKGDKCIIFSENREGWVYAFFSVWQNRGIAVPVDASSTVSDLTYILNDCRPQSIWVSRKCEQVAREAIHEAGLQIAVHIIEDFETLEAPEGLPTLENFKEETESTAIIIYTSGTTGNPKGVMLSYANLWANMHGISEEVPIYNSKRRVLVLLPVHHVLPLMGTIIAPILVGGGIIICPSMTGPDIMDSLCRGQVGIFIGVPRLWQILYGGIKKKIDSSAITRFLFNICAKAKSRTLSRFVFQSIQKKMGGHLDFCVSGGAALDREIGEGLRTLGLDVLEGYGMTETAPIITFTRPGDIIPGCVGLPLPSMECKLVNGELCARGSNVMQGYYNRPEETAAVIDPEGYIHTGDLARFDEKGRVYITGRSKEIIVLSNGKNVQPNEIEYLLEKNDSMVKEAAVMQDGDKLRAIMVPQELWARDRRDAEIELSLKREVLEPYNKTVENYKKIMSLCVYHGDLPRTKLDKLQRFKLKAILEECTQSHERKDEPVVDEPQTPEYQLLKQYIEGEKKVKIRPSDHLETDLAFDSLDRVALQGFIEYTFGMTVYADAMASFQNVQTLAEHIAQEKTRMEVGEINWNQLLKQQHTELDLPRTALLYPWHAKIGKFYFRLNNRLQIIGKENIPYDGPFILAPNHQSFFDGPIALSGLGWSNIKKSYFYATEEHVKGRILRLMAQRNNVIIMERHNLKNSIMKMAEVLKMGRNIVIFPEGSRTHTGEVGEFKKSFAILSMELGVPIVPVCIRGAYKACKRGSRIIKPVKIEVEYLKPIMATPEDTYATLSERVRSQIEAVLN